MNLWVPVFNKIVDSSIWREPDHVRIVWIAMLALKDRDQVVRFTAYALGTKCWPKEDETEAEKKALDALRILSEPDTRRLEPQPYEGRRIQKVEDGWMILNGKVYEDLMRKENRRNYQAGWQADYRAMGKAKGKPAKKEMLSKQMSDLGDERTAEQHAEPDDPM